jgi:two-component system invasion response regulator UvrY
MKATGAENPATRKGRQASQVRTLIVDDQEPFLEALRRLIAAVPGFVVAGEATSGEDALAMVDEVGPQLVLMDVRMPGMGGVQAARSLSERYPEIMVVLISVHGQEELPEALRGAEQPATFVHKQNLRPRMLRELWEQLGSG